MEGFEKVNARSIASKIGCSVQPIYSYFNNMEALMIHLHEYVNQYYIRYVEANANKQNYFGSIGKSHIFFANNEKHLFRFMFLSPYLQAESFRDFYKKLERSDVTQSIQDTLGLAKPDAEELYLNMMIYTHGIACMIATDAVDVAYEEAYLKVSFAYSSFLAQLSKEKA
jgi:AcrR family transcriptional regulator